MKTINCLFIPIQKRYFHWRTNYSLKNIIEAYYKVDRLLSDLNGMWSSMKYLFIHIRQCSGYVSIMHTFKANEYNPLHELCKFYCKWRIWKIFVCIQLFHLLSDNKHEFKTKLMLLNYFTIQNDSFFQTFDFLLKSFKIN